MENNDFDYFHLNWYLKKVKKSRTYKQQKRMNKIQRLLEFLLVLFIGIIIVLIIVFFSSCTTIDPRQLDRATSPLECFNDLRLIYPRDSIYIIEDFRYVVQTSEGLLYIETFSDIGTHPTKVQRLYNETKQLIK